jgi:hypothetical protein
MNNSETRRDFWRDRAGNDEVDVVTIKLVETLASGHGFSTGSGFYYMDTIGGGSVSGGQLREARAADGLKAGQHGNPECGRGKLASTGGARGGEAS